MSPRRVLALGYLLILAGVLLGLSADKLDGRVLVALLAISVGGGIAVRALQER